MNDDDSRSNTDGDKPESGFIPGERREPVFTDFDEDEDYEEADRDTDYASTYEEDSKDDEYLEPLEDEEPDDISTEWQEPEAPGATSTTRAAAENPWDVSDNTDAGEDDFDDADENDEVFQQDAGAYDPEPELLVEEDSAGEDSEEDWDDQDAYSDDPEDPLESGAHSWPLGLVIVGVVALVLLAAGGYGVIQQRSATQEEIRQLQATLATAASPADVAASREALREMEVRNKNLESTTDRLTLENRRLSDTVAGLEKQLTAQQEALSRATAPKPAAAKPAPKPASTTAGGDWFVNFSSYSQRSVAENWAKKLKPSAGKAVVAASSKDGKTFYRVRIVGLTDRAAARKVAGQLELAYKLPPLWVGSD